MIGFAWVGFIEIFLNRAIAHDRILVEFRGVFGVIGVERMFIFG